MASASVSWNQGNDVPTKPPAADQSSCHAIVDAWNSMAKDHGLSAVRAMPPARVAHLKARLAEVGETGMVEAIARVAASDFCRGGNNRRWKADFDTLLQPSTLVRILEGRYDNRRPAFHNGALEVLARERETSAMVIDGQDYHPLEISHSDD